MRALALTLLLAVAPSAPAAVLDFNLAGVVGDNELGFAPGTEAGLRFRVDTSTALRSSVDSLGVANPVWTGLSVSHFTATVGSKRLSGPRSGVMSVGWQFVSTATCKGEPIQPIETGGVGVVFYSFAEIPCLPLGTELDSFFVRYWVGRQGDEGSALTNVEGQFLPVEWDFSRSVISVVPAPATGLLFLIAVGLASVGAAMRRRARA
jgi:hypothetical protein